MAGLIIFCPWLFFGLISVSASHADKTLSLNERVNFLKTAIQSQINKNMRPGTEEINVMPPNHPERVRIGDYENIDLSGLRITPINENYKRKLHERYKLRQLRANKTITKYTKSNRKHKMYTHRATRKKQFEFAMKTTPHNMLKDGDAISFRPLPDELKPYNPFKQMETDEIKALKYGRIVRKKEVTANNPVDIFYKPRRMLSDEAIRDTPVQWAHCQELITPYIKGMVDELVSPKLIGSTHRTVDRILHLMNINTTLYSKQDIYHLMYQFSNLQIRLFEWEPDAIRLLFNALCHGKRHSFKALKEGLRLLFNTWHLDISDTQNLLEQARIFRPPCLGMQISGSTKSSPSHKYTTPAKSGETDEVVHKKIAFDGFECSGEDCPQTDTGSK